MLRVLLERVVKCGEEGGGEDLLLAVKVESDEEPHHAVLTAGLGAAVDRALAQLDGEELFLKDGRLHCSPTSAYEFRFELDREQLVKYAHSVAFDGEWLTRPDGTRFTAKTFYQDGNAD